MGGRAGRTTFERTAKPCGSDTRCWCQVGGDAFKPDRVDGSQNPPATVTRRIRRRGEHGISRKAITQGMPGASAEPVCSCAHPLSPLRTRPRGAARTRHSLRPLFWADGSCKARAPRAAGTRSRGLSQTDQTLRHFWDAANAKSKYREQMPRERRRRGKLSTHGRGEKGDPTSRMREGQ
jgi:hypothetical protein